MKQTFTARVFQEGNWFVAQCLELHFEPPRATIIPELQLSN